MPVFELEDTVDLSVSMVHMVVATIFLVRMARLPTTLYSLGLRTVALLVLPVCLSGFVNNNLVAPRDRKIPYTIHQVLMYLTMCIMVFVQLEFLKVLSPFIPGMSRRVVSLVQYALAPLMSAVFLGSAFILYAPRSWSRSISDAQNWFIVLCASYQSAQDTCLFVFLVWHLRSTSTRFKLAYVALLVLAYGCVTALVLWLFYPRLFRGIRRWWPRTDACVFTIDFASFACMELARSVLQNQPRRGLGDANKLLETAIDGMVGRPKQQSIKELLLCGWRRKAAKQPSSDSNGGDARDGNGHGRIAKNKNNRKGDLHADTKSLVPMSIIKVIMIGDREDGSYSDSRYSTHNVQHPLHGRNSFSPPRCVLESTGSAYDGGGGGGIGVGARCPPGWRASYSFGRPMGGAAVAAMPPIVTPNSACGSTHGMGMGIALDTASHNGGGHASWAGHRRRASASGVLPQMQQPQIQSHGSSASGMDPGHAGMEPSSPVMQRPLNPGLDELQTGIDHTHRTLDVSVSPTFPPSPPHSHATTQPLSMPPLRLDTQPGRGFGGALHSPTLDAHARHEQPLTSGVVVVSPHSHSDEITVIGMDPLGRTSQTSRHSGNSGGTTRVAPVTTPSPQLLPLPSPQLMQPRSPVLRVCDFDMSIGSGDSGTGSRLF